MHSRWSTAFVRRAWVLVSDQKSRLRIMQRVIKPIVMIEVNNIIEFFDPSGLAVHNCCEAALASSPKFKEVVGSRWTRWRSTDSRLAVHAHGRKVSRRLVLHLKSEIKIGILPGQEIPFVFEASLVGSGRKLLSYY